MGLARMGSTAGNGSGDIFVAFSTANGAAFSSRTEAKAQYIVNDRMDALFAATVQATEEAIVNAMVAARDMQGTEGHVAKALPHDQLIKLLQRYGRFTGKAP
jgi:D-aminopeptidase